MKVEIIYKKSIIKKELDFIKKNISFFEQNEMFFYFPFKSVISEEREEQINVDEKKFSINETRLKISRKWKKLEGEVFVRLERYNKSNNCFLFEKKYECYLTFYGCYGYYHFPNRMFVNVVAKPDFIIETIVHELIHLLIYKQTINKPADYVEKEVERIYDESGLKIFLRKE